MRRTARKPRMNWHERRTSLSTTYLSCKQKRKRRDGNKITTK